ncbi:MAG: molybdopterin-dependent oxidoreductase [Anaerolineales bacterium]|nr:molybdopterin-dependent oxidoreductase [Anaerolineales bacterium]
MKFWVNGKEVSVEIEPGEMLANVLRERLGLTGTKIACGEAECGACTVILDGEPVLSCSYPAEKAEGKHVTTIEGLAGEGELHPLQEAFIKFGAVQCGFCIPGQIMTAAALLEKNPEPDSDEIRYALKDTLCRCAGYPAIERAVLAAAETMRTHEPVADPIPLVVSSNTRVVGQMVNRPDSEGKVTGEAVYTDDLQFPGMLHGRVKRAGVASAILKQLDISAAKALPGVQAVLTAEDVPGERNHGVVKKDWPVMVGVGEQVRTVGDAVAVVAADTRAIASAALDLIETEYDLLPIVSDPREGIKPESQKVHEEGNLLKHIKVRKGNLENGLDQSACVLEDNFYVAATDHAFMETECSISRLTDEGRLEVYVGSQIPYGDREDLVRCLDLPVEKVRVIGQLIGGGFGGKEDIAGQIHAALLTLATGRPVKILYDRHESLIAHPKRHKTYLNVQLGADKEGNLVAAKTELFGDTGAYASLGEKVMGRATTHSTGPYIIPNVWADCFAVYTNNPPAGAFRGFGVYQSMFAIESMMDMLAEKLDMDPIKLRRKNALRVGAATSTGQELRESVGLVKCIDEVETKLKELTEGKDPWQPIEVEGAPHLRRVWGFAVAFKNTGLGEGAPDKAGAEVELYPDGTVEARTSSAELGQGLVTVLQMTAAEELGMPVEQVRVLLSDTDLTPDGGPTTASRQSFISGNAVRKAAQSLRDAMKSSLAEHFDCDPESIHFVEGLAQVGDRTVTMGEVVEIMKAEGHEPKAEVEYWAPKTVPLGETGDQHFAYSFAAQAVEIELDMDTGEVRVLRVISATDVGKALNPLGLEGQMEGGILMGIGHTLTEEFIVEDGQVFSDAMARYRIPSISLTPEIYPIVVEDPVAEGPYGGKGVGEIVIIPTPPAIANAVYRACGVRPKWIPIDQDWLARQIQEKED